MSEETHDGQGVSSRSARSTTGGANTDGVSSRSARSTTGAAKTDGVSSRSARPTTGAANTDGVSSRSARSTTGGANTEGVSSRSARSTTERTELYDLSVVVERIEGRSVCGMKVGDHIDLVESSRLCLPDGGHFCLYALQAVMPLLPAKQRRLPAGDWLERDDLVACPDPDERLIMRIVRTGIRSIDTDELT